MPKKALVAIPAVVLIAAAGFLYYQQSRSQAREQDWNAVDQAAVRLESGLRNEPIFSVRSKIADFDASLQSYVRKDKSRVDEPRVKAMKRALESIQFAIENLNGDASKKIVNDGESEFTTIATMPSAKPICNEPSGKLVYVNGVVATRQVPVAQKLLLTPDLDALNRAGFGPLSASELEQSRTQCLKANTDWKAQQIEARKAHWDQWPLHVDLRTGDGYLDVIMDEKREAQLFSFQGSRHFDARKSIHLIAHQCEEKDLRVSIRANDDPLKVKWQLTSWCEYETEIEAP